jgi:alpha-1,2-mannosyltransferase
VGGDGELTKDDDLRLEEPREPTTIRAAWLAAIVMLGVVEIWWAVGAHSFHDLRVYQGALRSWMDGGDLYAYVMPPANRYGFTYPPFTAIILAPLSLTTTRAASLGTIVATIGATVIITKLLVDRVPLRITPRRYRVVGIAVLALLGLFSTRLTLAEGQINMYVLALVVVDLLAPPGSRWRGAGVGLAAAIKLTPAVFIVYLFIAGRRRVAVTACATFVVCGLLGIVLAPHESIEFWTSVLWQTDRVGDAGSTSNASIRGVLARAMTGDVTLWWLAAAGLLTMMWWRRVRRATIRGDDAGALAVTGAFACLVSPITWIHHQVFLIPALAVLTWWAWQPRTSAAIVPPRRKFVVARRAVALLVYVALVIPLNKIAPDVYVLITLGLFLLLPLRERANPPAPRAEEHHETAPDNSQEPHLTPQLN